MGQMGLIIILGLLVWGWAEMSTFIYVGSEIGGLLTLLGVFTTAIFGIALLKRQGLSVLNQIQADLLGDTILLSKATTKKEELLENRIRKVNLQMARVYEMVRFYRNLNFEGHR